MKRFVALTVVLTAVLGLSIAFAGPERYESESKNVAPAPPPCDWSGFYLGLHGGLANYEATFTDLDYYEGFDSRVFEDTDFAGGGQIGYNWQKGAAVFGIEADGSWVNTDVHIRTIFGDEGETNPDFHDDDSELDFMGTLRGRAGLAVENALIYVTAGAAFGSGDRKVQYVEPGATESEDAGTVWHGEDFRAGWVAGVGAEYMVTCHWTVRLETLYTNFEDDTDHGRSIEEDDSDDENYRYKFDDELWNVRLGLNYKF